MFLERLELQMLLGLCSVSEEFAVCSFAARFFSVTGARLVFTALFSFNPFSISRVYLCFFLLRHQCAFFCRRQSDAKHANSVNFLHCRVNIFHMLLFLD